MSAIGKGDWVECMDASPHLQMGHKSLVSGGIYRVLELHPAGSIRGDRMAYEDAIDLVGDSLPYPFTWSVSRFRPIYRPKSSLIESLKRPAPDAVREL